MTATPRIYGTEAKAVAERDNVALYSMDNDAWYGKQLFLISFSEAVKRGLLVDYKVIVLAVEESHINRRLQNLLKANGVYGGPINGELNAATRTAVKSFQKKAGLPQTGEPDQNLFKALSGGKAL